MKTMTTHHRLLSFLIALLSTASASAFTTIPSTNARTARLAATTDDDDAEEAKITRILRPSYKIEPTPLRISAVASKFEAFNLQQQQSGFAKSLVDISQQSGDGTFAIINLSHVLDRLTLWKNTLPDVEVAYPVKVNPNPAIMEIMAGAGVGFDVASGQEIDLAIKAGGDPARMIFSHTVKRISHMKKAAAVGVKMSIVDSVDEMEKHAIHWPGAELLLRLTVERTDWNLGQKFGATLEEVPGLLREATKLGLAIHGVHFHVGSLATSAAPYLAALEDARTVMQMGTEAGYDMAIVNIGGGFQYPSDIVSPLAKQDFLTTATELKDSMAKFGSGDSSLPMPKFMAEPGTFMAMSSTSIVCRLAAVRNNCNIWVDESSYGSLNALSWKGYKDIVGKSISVLKMSESPPKLLRPPAGLTVVNGITCDWEDVIELPVELKAGSLSADDILLFDNMGAYSLACACDFNGFELSSMPIKYVYDSLSTHHKDGFQVRYTIEQIPGKGWGIVLCQAVKKGEPVWAFKEEGETHICHDEGSVRTKLKGFAQQSLLSCESASRFFLNHIFGWEGRMIELIGDCKFMNHSSEPVIETTDGKTWVASRDLSPGEEIVDNYGTYSNPDWYVDICKEYDVEWADLVANLYV